MRDDLVAELLQLQAAVDDGRVVLGHVHAALVAEEVGRVQHVDVQRVALDPLAAVEQAAERAERAVDRRAEGFLHRLHGAHLVGDRADAADPRRDVGRLGEAAARAGTPRRTAAARRCAATASLTTPFCTLTVNAPSPSTRASTSTLIVRPLAAVTLMRLTRLPEGFRSRVVAAQQPHDVGVAACPGP